MEKNVNSIKILVVISGGVVQNIFSNEKSLIVDILDFDNEEFIDEDSANMEFEKRRQSMIRIG